MFPPYMKNNSAKNDGSVSDPQNDIFVVRLQTLPNQEGELISVQGSSSTRFFTPKITVFFSRTKMYQTNTLGGMKDYEQWMMHLNQKRDSLW